MAILALVLAATPAAAQNRTIVVDASTTFAPLLGEVAQSYGALQPETPITVNLVGSIAAANAVQNGTADVAFVDSSPAVSLPVYAQRIFALPLAVVISPQAGVSALTRAQVGALFNGGYTSWKELGGADIPVRPFTRPAQSAMVAAFVTTFGSVPKSGESLTGSAEIVNAVSSTPGGLGFTTLAAARDANLPIAAIDGHPASGPLGPSAYPFYALGYVVTNGPPAPFLSRFLAYVETRRPLLAKYGIVSVRDLAP